MKNSSPKIVVTGGNGQLASAIKKLSRDNASLITLARDELDITEPASILSALKKFTPDIIVNTAAYTAVDKAESDHIAADRSNHLGAKNLAEICQQNNISLIHISTDYVFDGEKQTGYLEDDITNPINFYGQSKWLGEEAIREYCEKHIILRVSGVFSEFGNNFYKTILRLASERKELRIVSDQITCPTYAGDIAAAILKIANHFQQSGTYHFCSQPKTSWYDFAAAIINQAKSQRTLTVENIKSITTAEYPTPAKRPLYSVLNCDKIAKDYGILQPSWNSAIQLIGKS